MIYFNATLSLYLSNHVISTDNSIMMAKKKQTGFGGIPHQKVLFKKLFQVRIKSWKDKWE